MDKKISTKEYKKRTVYEWFNNKFPADCVRPDLNLPLINIADRLRPDKRARYTPDLIPDAISVSSEKSVSTLTTPSDSPRLLILTSDNNHHHHSMKKYEPYHGKMKRGYCSSKCDEKGWKKRGSIDPHALIKTRKFINVMGFPVIIQRRGIDSWNINIVWKIVQLVYVFASILSFNLPVEIVFFCLFYSCSIDHYLFQSLCMTCLKFLTCIVFIDCLNACDESPFI